MTGLRDALDELVHDVNLPAGYLQEIRRTHRHRTQRWLAGAAVIPIAVVAAIVFVGIPGPDHRHRLAATSPQQMSAALAVVDGVRVTYLPAGFRLTNEVLTTRSARGSSLWVSAEFSKPPVRGAKFGTTLSVEVHRGTLAVASNAGENGGQHLSVQGHDALLGHATNPAPDTSAAAPFVEWSLNRDLSVAVVTDDGPISDRDVIAVADGVDGSGPSPAQPADQAAAKTAVSRAFSAAFGSGSRAGRLAAVEGGALIADGPAAPYEQDLQYEDIAVKAPIGDSIVFTDAAHALLIYSASTHVSPEGEPEPGAAILVQGQWKVASRTWCAVVGLDACPAS